MLAPYLSVNALTSNNHPLLVIVEDLPKAYTANKEKIYALRNLDSKYDYYVVKDNMWYPISGDALIENLSIENNSISTNKIIDQSITTNKIEDGAITLDKLSDEVKEKFNTGSDPVVEGSYILFVSGDDNLIILKS